MRAATHFESKLTSFDESGSLTALVHRILQYKIFCGVGVIFNVVGVAVGLHFQFAWQTWHSSAIHPTLSIELTKQLF